MDTYIVRALIICLISTLPFMTFSLTKTGDWTMDIMKSGFLITLLISFIVLSNCTIFWNPYYMVRM